jgi:hypothetical protein
VAGISSPQAPILVQPKVVVVQPQPIAKTQLEVWTPYLPLALTMIGWFVVSRLQDRRERRKEVRELVRLVEQRIDDLLEIASDYYLMDGKNPKCVGLASKINSKMSSVSQLLNRLTKAGLDHDVTDRFINFKQSVTGTAADFESIDRRKQDSSGSILAAAAAAGFTLVSGLEETYFAAFPVRMKPIWQFWGG